MLPSIFGFISGIAVGSFFPINFGFFISCIFLSVLLYFYKYFVEENQKEKIILCSIVLLGLSLGMGRILISDLYKNSHLNQFVGQKISAEGIIVAEPDVREKNTKLTIKLTSLVLASSTLNIKEKVLVTTSIYPEFYYGDRVKLNITLKEPENIESEDGRVFDYKGYLRARGIWYTSSFTSMKLISSGHGSLIKTGLFKIKHAFTNALNNALPEPESSLMAGLLLGSKQSLGKELLSEFQRTGTSHIVVLSGYTRT